MEKYVFAANEDIVLERSLKNVDLGSLEFIDGDIWVKGISRGHVCKFARNTKFNKLISLTMNDIEHDYVICLKDKPGTNVSRDRRLHVIIINDIVLLEEELIDFLQKHRLNDSLLLSLVI